VTLPRMGLSMRTTMVAMLVASGTMITLPALAQQQPASNPQMQEDKGAKTGQSGESGYVGEQEKPGASARPLERLTLLRRQRAQPRAPRPGRQAAVKSRAEPSGGVAQLSVTSSS
jgi:Spy/CpxP family protein refolding chaperone